MNHRAFDFEGNVRDVIDTIPSAVFIADRDFTILDMNAAAADMLGPEALRNLSRLCGVTLMCRHDAQGTEGCGNTEHCSDCGIRKAIEAASAGRQTRRETHGFEMLKNGRVDSRQLRITAAPIVLGRRHLISLVLEDVTELVELRQLLPICSLCKKIRNDDGYWKSVEIFFNRHDFTHSICPECMKQYYPDID